MLVAVILNTCIFNNLPDAASVTGGEIIDRLASQKRLCVFEFTKNSNVIWKM
jgi:hypothetical protein